MDALGQGGRRSFGTDQDGLERWYQFYRHSQRYGNGEIERIIAKGIKTFKIPRDRLVIATKCLMPVIDDSSVGVGTVTPCDIKLINNGGLSRKVIFDAVEASLKHLELNYIDLLTFIALTRKQWEKNSCGLNFFLLEHSHGRNHKSIE
jgi:aryl-alcohol dehydrogenase-like predicted oxidoreductase